MNYNYTSAWYGDFKLAPDGEKIDHISIETTEAYGYKSQIRPQIRLSMLLVFMYGKFFS